MGSINFRDNSYAEVRRPNGTKIWVHDDTEPVTRHPPVHTLMSKRTGAYSQAPVIDPTRAVAVSGPRIPSGSRPYAS